MKSSFKKGLSIILIILGPIITQSFVNAQTDKEVSAKSVSQSSVKPDSDSYVIGPDDVLSIQIWKEDALSKTVTVRTDGKISLPLIDDIQAAGFTPLKLKEILTEKFKEYVDAPLVTVIVQNAKSYKIYISGEIGKPGVYSLVEEISIIQFIPMTGGFTPWANQKKILVIRREKGKETRIIINYKKIVSGEDMTGNIMLKPGDTIIVPN
jgi:polysaccharide biosynthesis/export protein